MTKSPHKTTQMKSNMYPYPTNRLSFRNTILLFLLLFAGMANAQTVTIPDAHFKAQLIALAIDSNSDGNIQVSEAQAATTLNISYLDITDLTGIEAFTNLTSLACTGNLITTLDVSPLTNLVSLYCNENQLTSLNINGLTALQELHCENNQLTSLDVTGHTALTKISCFRNQITGLNVGSLSNLTSILCSFNQLTSLDVSNLMALQYLECGYNQIPALAVDALTNLITLDCSSNTITGLNLSGLTLLESLYCSGNQLSVLDVSSLASLKNLNCGTNHIPVLNLNGLVNLLTLDCDYNQLSALDVSGQLLLQSLNCAKNQIPVLNVSNLTNLELLNCGQNVLTTLDVNNLTNLQYLTCDGNQLTTLNINALVNLIALSTSSNNLTALDVSPFTHLTNLDCSSNQISILDLSNNTDLIYLDCSINTLMTLEVNNLTHLQTLNYGNNTLPGLNFSGLVNLRELFLGSTGRISLDLTNHPHLMNVYCAFNPITVIDASSLSELTMLSCGSPVLTHLFLKNGKNESLFISNSPNISVVCADESQLANVSSVLAAAGASNAILTSYCTLVPGGNYNTITGLSRFDLNNNGCDDQDVPSNNVKFNISSGTINEASLVNPSSGYAFYTEAGNYTVTPQFENPAYFNITPASAVFDFPALDNSTQTQDFCLTANGIHPDLEIVIMPIGAARPGFDAQYQIVYKNKGNQMLSGAVNLTFDDARTDFVTAIPAVDSQTLNSLVWNYLNLSPFESRSIYFTLNINTPLEIPAVNSGDILDFTSTITFAASDDTPADNVSVLHQTAINSMDPNAKTCLEGITLSPDEIGKYMHYSIEFENVGNAEAVNVEVKDMIDTTMFDINSLQVLYTSHPSQTTIRGNVVEFIFKDINLAPLDGDPPVGGHGTILFKIKTLPTLSVGDHVENKANIYFDYNAKIETNIARTTFAVLSNPEFPVDKSIVVYPNPVKDSVTIECASMIKSVGLYDIQGRILQTVIVNEKTTVVDLSGKAGGVYFVKIVSENGIKVEKVVKE